jgi:RimJ/RimL family protein N-acetyltransferase
MPDMPLQLLSDELAVDNELRLRLPRRSDRDALIAAAQDPEVPRWTTLPANYGEEAWETFISKVEQRQRDGALERNYVITDSADQFLGVLGSVRVREEDENAEVGYWLASHARGRGVLARALTIVLKSLLEAGYQRVDAEVLVGNSASQKTLERVGFTHEGILRSIGNHGCGDGVHRIDVHMYSVILSDPIAQQLLGVASGPAFDQHNPLTGLAGQS